ncbi:leukocyte-associated immunoglobulin-like receptor 1 isoform X2 [Mesocricetus auratus]|uniref:Leukocyte-associated immunoglobulin-like receptor 1 isoform X2 n=1 Tax=Mesocricetus auratus TaxID=10036 RepID=A0A1U8CUN9_MESAU|nr:leukocyte-associated immunoglobulin-like receptor 1 isoform X2 [Mesocricetus auratus]
MSLCLATVLAVVLCLGQTVNTKEGFLEIPSISAEPGLTVPQGHFVIFVCSSSSGYDIFRLEKKNWKVMDETSTPDSLTEARFRLGPVDDSFAGSYTCIYEKESTWSPRSEALELMVTREYVTQAPDPGKSTKLGKTTPSEETWTYKDKHDTSWLKTNGVYILTGVSVIFLLCLLLLLLFCFHSHRQKKQGLTNSKKQQQRPQKRLSLVTNGLESTPDIVTDDRLPEDRRSETQIPVAGGLQEVTYAHLDHHALTQRTAGAMSPQSRDTTPESSTYAAIIRR